MAPLVVFAGPRGMSSRRAWRSSIALATCSETLCRLRMFENADASIMLSSLSRLPSSSASALKSASLWLSWNFSESSYTATSDS